MNLDRWQSLMGRLGFAGHRDVYDDLLAAYSERHRCYHTGAHIADCLQRLDEAAGLAHSVDNVELALWFHDAVYAPRRQDNERRSADWAVAFLERAGAEDDRRARVRDHIVATEHATTAPADPDSALVVDIDLAILGSPPEAYRVFETDIRREYRWVPAPLYRRKRREVLNGFLARPRIYATDHFRDRCEAPARDNLQAAIQALA